MAAGLASVGIGSGVLDGVGVSVPVSGVGVIITVIGSLEQPARINTVSSIIADMNLRWLVGIMGGILPQAGLSRYGKVSSVGRASGRRFVL